MLHGTNESSRPQPLVTALTWLTYGDRADTGGLARWSARRPQADAYSVACRIPALIVRAVAQILRSQVTQYTVPKSQPPWRQNFPLQPGYFFR
jgi:hypothetical protein